MTARCGVAAFPDALLLFSGENIGKLVLRVADARRRLAPEPRLVVRRGKRGGLFSRSFPRQSQVDNQHCCQC